MKRWLPPLGALLGGVLGFAIAWHFARGDIDRAGDWRPGYGFTGPYSSS